MAARRGRGGGACEGPSGEDGPCGGLDVAGVGEECGFEDVGLGGDAVFGADAEDGRVEVVEGLFHDGGGDFAGE